MHSIKMLGVKESICGSNEVALKRLMMCLCLGEFLVLLFFFSLSLKIPFNLLFVARFDI